MHITRLPFSQLPMLAKTDRAYSESEPILRKFYAYDVNIQSFAQIIADKSKTPTDRATLVQVLKTQYSSLDTEGSVAKNIASLLSETTFTVTTAHQPSVLLGPLYFIYKIFSTIHLAENLNATYPENHFVPTFVIGGEDHDFEEINHANLFGKQIVWQRGDDEKGAVGMMKTDSLHPFLTELQTILGDSDAAKAAFDLIEKSYSSHAIYHDAHTGILLKHFCSENTVWLSLI